jgi:hypothetical protein
MARTGMVLALLKVVWMKERKRFFFEKKKQKTFDPWGMWQQLDQGPQLAEVFLLLFFQKKKLFLPSDWRLGWQGVDAGFRRHDGWEGLGALSYGWVC